jgi:hypothetical protein
MTRKPKPYGSLGLSGEMPRHKSEDQQKIEKILREEHEKQQHFETYDQVLQRQARQEQERAKSKPLK